MKPLDLAPIEADSFESDVDRVLACTARLRRIGHFHYWCDNECRLRLFDDCIINNAQSPSRVVASMLALALLVASFYFVVFSSRDSFLVDYGALE